MDTAGIRSGQVGEAARVLIGASQDIPKLVLEADWFGCFDPALGRW